MASTESTFKNNMIVLLLLTAVCGFAMAVIYSFTKEKIRAAQKAKINNAIQQVIPDYDAIADKVVMPFTGKDSITIHRLSKAGTITGYAVETYTDIGYNGRFCLMVGFNSNESISNTEVLEHHETPGLGTKMNLPAFKDQFKGLNIETLKGDMLKVTKDGGTIDAISAATISSRAFCDAVNRAHATLRKEEFNESAQ